MSPGGDPSEFQARAPPLSLGLHTRTRGSENQMRPYLPLGSLHKVHGAQSSRLIEAWLGKGPWGEFGSPDLTFVFCKAPVVLLREALQINTIKNKLHSSKGVC